MHQSFAASFFFPTLHQTKLKAMNKRLSALLAITCMLTAGIFFYSCTKSGSLSKQESMQNLQEQLYQSDEYANFVAATNRITASLTVAGIQSADINSAAALMNNKESFTKEELAAILSKLHVNDAVYMQSHQAMLQAVKGFQAKHHISNNENALVWEQVIQAHKESFKAPSALPDIQGFIDCVVASVQEFAVTTAVCLALRDIPIIGEELYRICETEAINNLISNLTGCLDYLF